MKINVFIENKAVTLEMQPSDTLGRVLQMAASKREVPSADYELFYNGQLLNGKKSVASAKFPPNPKLTANRKAPAASSTLSSSSSSSSAADKKGEAAVTEFKVAVEFPEGTRVRMNLPSSTTLLALLQQSQSSRPERLITDLDPSSRLDFVPTMVPALRFLALQFEELSQFKANTLQSVGASNGLFRVYFRRCDLSLEEFDQWAAAFPAPSSDPSVPLSSSGSEPQVPVVESSSAEPVPPSPMITDESESAEDEKKEDPKSMVDSGSETAQKEKEAEVLNKWEGERPVQVFTIPQQKERKMEDDDDHIYEITKEDFSLISSSYAKKRSFRTPTSSSSSSSSNAPAPGTQVKIMFHLPNQLRVLGLFLIDEPLSSLFAFVKSTLADAPAAFEILSPVRNQKIEESEQTIRSAQLYPSSSLHVVWKVEGESVPSLRTELVASAVPQPVVEISSSSSSSVPASDEGTETSETPSVPDPEPSLPPPTSSEPKKTPAWFKGRK